MTNRPYSTPVQDPSRVRVEATDAGTADARRGYPKTSAAGQPAVDYYGTASQASARTAAMLHLANYLQADRPHLDRSIAEAVALVVRLTAWVGDLLFKTSAADHEAQAFKQLPLAARHDPWPGWLRLGLLVVMALGTGAALSGALLELTSDEPYYVWGFCLATTLAVVGLGAFLANLARSFEYNRLQAHQFTTGLLPKVILGVGALFAVLLMVALAWIRGTASEADAARQSRTDSGVTVMLPGEAPPDVAPQPEAPLPSVGSWTFGILEGLLFMAAFGVEYLNYLPWAEQRRRAEQTCSAVEGELHLGQQQLGSACGQLLTSLDERATRDAAVLLAGEATLVHVTAEASDYRRALLSLHPNLAGDPFNESPAGGVPLPLTAHLTGEGHELVTTEVAQRWGRDLQPDGLIQPDVAYDHLEANQLAPTALARGLAMLAKVPERAGFKALTWDPALLVQTARPASRPADRALGVKARRTAGRQPASRPTSVQRSQAAAGTNGSKS